LQSFRHLLAELAKDFATIDRSGRAVKTLLFKNRLLERYRQMARSLHLNLVKAEQPGVNQWVFFPASVT
jgi:hypothetical protein